MASRWALALVEGVWYGNAPVHRLLSMLLTPLAWLVCVVARLREMVYARGWVAAERLAVPVILVGNLSVGGTGKTPLVIWLARHLSDQGLRVGVMLRGYGNQGGVGAHLLPGPDADPRRYGDEAVLITQRTGCPVAIGRDRVGAGRLLLAQVETGLDVLISDDGLQHHRLHRDLEILVIDGERGFGNGRCLPAGPLREPRSRQLRVDLVLINGQGRAGQPGMQLHLGEAISLENSDRHRPLQDFLGHRVTAVAGIGNPNRFFSALRQQGLDIRPMAYSDHHGFVPADAQDWSPGPVLMTEKDAVKCRGWSRPDYWYVPVEAEPDEAFAKALNARLAGLSLSPTRRSSKRKSHG